jgi:23S rRNA U2552 (ribose-2'-O)-methylase RlmE/FtsJ
MWKYELPNTNNPPKKIPLDNTFIEEDMVKGYYRTSKNKEKFHQFNQYNKLMPYGYMNELDKSYKEEMYGQYTKRFYNKKPINYFTSYIPFFPNTFFPFLELLNIIKPNLNNCKIFVNDNKEHQGALEALFKYSETNLFGSETEIVKLCIDRKSYSCNENRFNKIYQIQIHTFPPCKFKSVCDYYKGKKNQPNIVISDTYDIINNITFLKLIKNGGKAIIRISIKELYQLQLLRYLFGKIELHKPKCQHPLDPSIYVVLSDYIGENGNNIESFVLQPNFQYEQDDILKELVNKLVADYREKMVKYFDKNNSTKNIGNKYLDKWVTNNNMITNSDFKLNFQPPSFSSLMFPNIEQPKNLFPCKSTHVQYNELLEIKKELNKYKRLIDTKEQDVTINSKLDIIDWNKLTDDIDYCKTIRRNLRNLDLEMVTNAWMKFYEILSCTSYFSKLENKKTIKVFHLCEAPGAFISCMNHFIYTKTNINKYIWYAQTLNPYVNTNQSARLDDNFGLISLYPDRWLFGKSNTGDITNIKNILDYKTDPKLANIDLITADGGLCLEEGMFNEQERHASKLLYSQILTILMMLPNDKTCIFKTYLPLAEPITVSMFYILSFSFENVILRKPISSHPSSSEIYVECTGYKGWNSFNQPFKSYLISFLDKFDTQISLFEKDGIPEEFINRLSEISRNLCNRQIMSIKKSLYLRGTYYSDKKIKKSIDNYKDEISKLWIDTYLIKKLPYHKKLIRHTSKN